MAGTTSVKIVVIYPQPTDVAEFERVYKAEHVPMVEDKLKGVTRLVLTKVVTSPQGKVAAYRLAEVHFSTMEDLNKAVESDAGKAVVAHAQKISTGGPPIMLICTDETFVYW
jgi:uncharacterized protein (TIGR02118 family)